MKIPLTVFLLVPAFISLVILFVSSRYYGVQLETSRQNVNQLGRTPDLPVDDKTKIEKLHENAGLEIPACEASPWKESENLLGTCPSGLKPYKEATTAEACATACCQSDACITWQFRKDTGCLQGKDVRFGMEKDGPKTWCDEKAPRKWQGQFVLKRGNGQILKTKEQTGGCSLKTWNPNEQQGQCFGLGDVKKTRKKDKSIVISSAQGCMEACCDEDDCGAWQWQDGLGCFYHKRMHGCIDASDPIVFEPFVGRRKKQASRSYTDKQNKPWSQNLS